MRVGITGQSGFVGTHLYNRLGLLSNIERIAFSDCFFENELALRNFVKQCDVIVHLAAMNRHENPEMLYENNIQLNKLLINAMLKENVTPHVIFSSSTQESLDNSYGRSKLEGRKLIETWANDCGAPFSGLVVPNVYGEFARPNYNTFIATFAYKIVNGELPEIHLDADVKLIYIASLCKYIIEQFPRNDIRRIEVPYDFEKKVSEILALFLDFKTLYLEQGIIPILRDRNEINLFNTFRSYIDYSNYFPVKLVMHRDTRGVFVETIKLGVGGQISFSTTMPSVTRGNHYHTRKIERFTVIKGKALIQLRKIGGDDIINFYLDGTNPSYVDMPIWYTHNITNIGEEELYTQFWINEWYKPEDGDTYFETV